MKPNEQISPFTAELISILNRQYPNHHFDGIVQWFVSMALNRSGYTLVPPSNNAVHLTPAAVGSCDDNDTEPQVQVTADR